MKIIFATLLLMSSLFSVEIVIDEDLSREEYLHIRQNVVKQEYVIIDNLMWQDDKDAITIKKNWNQANAYCMKLILGGYDGWFLPNLKELQSLAYWMRKPTIKENFFNTIPYWSSSTDYWTSSQDTTNSNFAYTLRFSNSDVYRTTKSEHNYIRCVRQMPQNYALIINTIPSNAVIDVENVNYYNGVKLKQGIYKIKITKDGYYPKTGTIELNSDLNIDVKLKRIVK